MRSIDRRRELAIRMALGARRSEIARQLVLESEAVVALGIGGGVLLALWLTPVLGRIALEQFGGVANGEVAVSWRVIGLIATAATLGGGICGLLPALVASRGNVVGVLSRGITAAPREPGLRRLFVAGEVALACVLLVLLSIVGRSLHDVLTVNPGFDARGLLTLQVSVPAASYADDERVASFYSALQRALEERLGTGTTSLINEMPLTGDGGRRLVRVRPSDAVREVVVREAGPGYFDVMRIAVAAGRPFDGRDGLAAPQRVVVSESLANALFGTGQPIGRHLRVGDPDAPPAEIIGVVGDVKHRALDEEGFLPTAYLSAWRSPSRSMILVVRSPKPDADVIAAVRQEVEALDRHVPVYRIRPMHDIDASSPGVAARHLLTATFMGFALLAVVLCGIGLFGIVAHDVASRRTELALRIALGADPTRIVLATLGRAGFTVGAGLAVGCATSLWAARAVSSVMFGPSPFDVLNLALAAAVLLAVGAAAVLPPARRAARTDPFSALRTE